MTDDVTALAEAVGVLEEDDDYMPTKEDWIGLLSMVPLFLSPLLIGGML